MARKKVLWVDDEIEYLRSHIMFLETRGYSVTPVFTGDDAIHLIRKKPDEFDIVLLDEQMPGKDGLTTLGEIKAMMPELPVVMVTKSEEEELMEQALGRKIDGYLTKPVNPSQILLVCKRLLHSKELISSQLKQDFVRNYSLNRSALQEKLNVLEWIRLYKNLVKWDIELADTRDEGIRQAHIGQKFDANGQFSDFIEAHYMRWMSGEGKGPIFSPRVLETHCIPHLRSGEKVLLIIIDSLRLDHFIQIHSLLKNYFSIESHVFFSILPSSPEFSRSSILSGLYPIDIEKNYPAAWADIIGNTEGRTAAEAFLLKQNLERHAVTVTPELIKIIDDKDAQDILSKLDSFYDSMGLTTIAVDFISLFLSGQLSSSVLQDMATDETSFRKVVTAWFEYSKLFQILQYLSQKDCTIIFTTSNGNVLCTRGTESYGNISTRKNLRYQYGENVTCDERYAFYLHEPSRFKLPTLSPNTSYIVLKENYYFIDHDIYQHYNEHYQNTFQHGGISMEEMIVPIAIMRPKGIL
ncbi:MAG: response regulator [Chitinivibrionales bacterium]|nr:response regulator [Chitinivibrionales bacterium]